MNNVKVNGNTYNGIERIRLTSADGGTVDFCDATPIDAAIAGQAYDIYNSVVTAIDVWPFAKASKIELPNVTSIKNNALYNTTITEARFENLVTSGGGLFLSCTKLTKAILGKNLSALQSQDCRACSALTTLVLRYEGVVSINVTTNNATFKDSAIASGTGYVYVPSSQVENYKANSAWSTYADQIRAIEDYPDETA